MVARSRFTKAKIWYSVIFVETQSEYLFVQLFLECINLESHCWRALLKSFTSSSAKSVCYPNDIWNKVLLTLHWEAVAFLGSAAPGAVRTPPIVTPLLRAQKLEACPSESTILHTGKVMGNCVSTYNSNSFLLNKFAHCNTEGHRMT